MADVRSDQPLGFGNAVRVIDLSSGIRGRLGGIDMYLGN